MKPENLIKIANFHSLYGESNLYTIEAHKHSKKQFFSISFFKLLLQTLVNWSENYNQRKRLSELNDYYLKDIGLTRYDVQHEADKWFWQD